MSPIRFDGDVKSSCPNYEVCESAEFCGVGGVTCPRKLMVVLNDATIPAEEKQRELAAAISIGMFPEGGNEMASSYAGWRVVRLWNGSVAKINGCAIYERLTENSYALEKDHSTLVNLTADEVELLEEILLEDDRDLCVEDV